MLPNTALFGLLLNVYKIMFCRSEKSYWIRGHVLFFGDSGTTIYAGSSTWSAGGVDNPLPEPLEEEASGCLPSG